MTSIKRIMGLDHGLKRIGVALSDPLGLGAQPHSIIKRTTLKEDFAKLKAIIDQQGVETVVVGLPSDAEDGIGSQAASVIRWSRKLKAEIQIPIIVWDEAYSSEQAVESREGRRRRAKSAHAPIDDLAAAIILQDYLRASNATSVPGTPLEDYEYIE